MLEAQLNYSLKAHKCGLGTLTREALVTIGSGPNNRGGITVDCRQVWPVKGIQRGLSSEAMGAELSMPLLHRRLGHSTERAPWKMIKGDMVRGIDGVKQEYS